MSEFFDRIPQPVLDAGLMLFVLAVAEGFFWLGGRPDYILLFTATCLIILGMFQSYRRPAKACGKYLLAAALAFVWGHFWG